MALVLAAVAALPAMAQERSDTGRRKPPRPAPVQEVERRRDADEPSARALEADPDRWLAGVGLGLGDSGVLFRVETLSGVPAAWGPVGDTRFRASRFTATMDPGADISAHVARRLGHGRWWLRGEFASSAADVAAEALLGQGGEVYFYDRATFLALGLGVEARLTSWPSHPYAVLAVAACRVAADRYAGLADSGLGARAAIGYRQRVRGIFLGIEAGLTRIAIDISDFRPSIAEAQEPAFSYHAESDLWRTDLRLVASRRW
ncbi:MAG: hypothetical protein IPK64_09840 [bacterium]|nr:hypothetical protein [bacterium]